MSLSLDALQTRAASDGDAPVLVAGTRQVSAAALRAAIDGVADTLVDHAVRVLAIAADNSPDWAIADLAAQQARVVVVPIPPFFSPGQVAHVLADSGADAIAADEAGSVPLLSQSTRFAAELTPTLSLLRLPAVQNGVALPAATAKINYTSGTTAAPRGACLSQTAMDHVVRSLSVATAGLGIRRHLCLLPLATLLENIGGIYAPLLAGASIALPPLDETGLRGASGLDVVRLVECLNRYRPESVILLPELLSALVGAAEQGAGLPESLKFAAVGGGVVGEPMLERADRLGIPVFEGYGLTECCSVVALNTPEARRPGSVGRPLPHCRVRVGDDGEIFVGGATMAGYLGQSPLRSAEIATGDIGRLDHDGFLYVSGRKKNVLITSYGRNLSPEWVEAALTSKDSIAQAVLFGDGKPFNVAVIVPESGVSAAAVDRDVAAANSALPDYARIRFWIRADEPFSPSSGTATPNGRIRRQVVRNRYGEGIDACYRSVFENYA